MKRGRNRRNGENGRSGRTGRFKKTGMDWKDWVTCRQPDDWQERKGWETLGGLKYQEDQLEYRLKLLPIKCGHTLVNYRNVQSQKALSPLT